MGYSQASSGLTEQAEAIQGIASVAEEQSASTEQVSASAAQVSEQVATMTAQAQELATTAAQLKALVSQFTIDDHRVEPIRALSARPARAA